MPNGQNILVKCEVKSRGGDVFDMIVAHSNLVEHFYFGLAYIDGKETEMFQNEVSGCGVVKQSYNIIPC